MHLCDLLPWVGTYWYLSLLILSSRLHTDICSIKAEFLISPHSGSLNRLKWKEWSQWADLDSVKWVEILDWGVRQRSAVLLK